MNHSEENASISMLAEVLGLDSREQVFPWQKDLLARFRKGDIPSCLDIPTGLGKTAVMAVWLVALAHGATLPRRLVYVVDRRAVVDQATTEAERLREFLERHEDLKSKLNLSCPLSISTLRGRHVDNREWLEDPSAPAVIVGTVDMIGSRLLFEGYGVSRKMRPYHAGLLGVDTLVVLDEAHLVPPFEHLLRAVEAEQSPQKILGNATTPVPLCPALTGLFVDTCAMTSLDKPTDCPDNKPWLCDWIDDDPPQTAVVWRTYLPMRAGGLSHDDTSGMPLYSDNATVYERR